MTVDEARSVLIVACWLGWQPDPVNVVPGDAITVDALASLAVRAAATVGLQRSPTADDITAAFEAHCQRLRGTPEAEQVCEALERHWGINANYSTAVALADALDRWKATRAAT